MTGLVRAAPPPPIPAPLALLAAPLAWAYGVGVGLRNARFDRGVGVRTLPLPVISVGNITAGGTGKTPFVAWTASMLRRRGHRPLIAMRGYRAAAGEAGDEEREYRSILDGVEIVADPRRFEAVSARLAARADAGDARPDCILLDDGFQHRQLHRDLDIVLVDATRPALGDRLLPSGWLREPARGLARASAVVVTRADGRDAALERRIAELHGRPPIAWTRHGWRALDSHAGAGSERLPLSWLRGKRVVVACGVGNPRSVVAAAEECGATIAASLLAADHAAVTAETLKRLAEATRGADAALVTRKDWVKFEALGRDAIARAGVPRIVVPDLALEFLEGEEAVIAAVRAALAKPAL